MPTPTPILDLAETEPFHEREEPSLIVRGIVLILSLLFGLVPLATIFVPHAGLISFLLPYVCFFIAVAVHELGHLFAALSVGFPIKEVHIGIFGFYRDADGFAFDVKMANALKGLVKCGPNDRRFTRARFIFIAAAGLLANLAAGLLCLSVRHRGVFLEQFAWINLIMFAMSLLPGYQEERATDGRALWILARPRQAAQYIAIHQIASAAEHVPTAQWSAEEVANLTACRVFSRESVVAFFFAAYYAMARHDLRRAAALLEEALKRSSRASPALRQAIFRLASVLQLMRFNLRASTEWLRRANFEKRDPSTRGLLGLV